MIVDTHTHIVSPDQARYPRDVQPVGFDWVRDMPITAEEMLRLAEEAGIDRTVLVQSWGVYLFDNNYVVDSARRYAGRCVSVVFIDVEREGVADRMRYWVKERGARGIRLLTSSSTSSGQALGTRRLWPDTARMRECWKTAAELRVPICVLMQPHQIPPLRKLLEEFPETLVAVDHLGYPGYEEGPPYEGMKPLFDLAALPNLYLKFSTLSFYGAVKGKSTPRDIFQRLVDRFGPQRLMWGSNFPNTYDRPLKEQLSLAREALAFLPEKDQRWLFGETALMLYTDLRETAT